MIDEKYKTMLLGKDDWFDKYHAENLTNEFCEWWIGYYGEPSHASPLNSRLINGDYYIRMSFALTAWNEALQCCWKSMGST